MATVELTPEAAWQFDRMPLPIRARVNRLRERLARWPEVSGVKALSGNLAGHYRLRTGDYRLRFRVEGDKVIVDKIVRENVLPGAEVHTDEFVGYSGLSDGIYSQGYQSP